MQSKSEIRAKIKELKSKLSKSEIQAASSQVKTKIESSLWFKNATHILTYASLPDELGTSLQLIDWMKTKYVYLPRVNDKDLEILLATETRIGSFNIEEPIGDNIININNIDLIIVPGVAFDYHGTRIGRGKGFYDRLLSNSNALKIGIGYDFQVLDKIPSEPHDITMDAIITPNNFILLNKTPWD